MKVTKLAASLTQLLNNAAKGDTRSILAVLELARTHEARESGIRPVEALDEADRRVIALMASRLRNHQETSDGS